MPRAVNKNNMSAPPQLPLRPALKPPPQKPEWLKARLPSGASYLSIKSLLRGLNLSTVCEEAACPNIGECWAGGTATIMIMGDTCTRGCRFCNVKTGNPKGWLDEREPEKTAFAISRLKLKYVVLTSVDRDDLPDEGAGHFAKVVSRVKAISPEMLVEALAPDFSGRESCLETLLRSRPDVFAHNVETVERLSPKVRDRRAGYRQSLMVLETAKKKRPEIHTKSSLMLGLGEREAEIRAALRGLRAAGCDVITFGQYLRPRKRHLPVERYLPPAEFDFWKKEAEAMGFLYCASGPLIRSSYRAGELFMEAFIRNKRAAEKTAAHAGRI